MQAPMKPGRKNTAWSANRRLSIASLPVYQPLPFHALQPNDEPTKLQHGQIKSDAGVTKPCADAPLQAREQDRACPSGNDRGTNESVPCLGTIWSIPGGMILQEETWSSRDVSLPAVSRDDEVCRITIVVIMFLTSVKVLPSCRRCCSNSPDVGPNPQSRVEAGRPK